MKSTLIPGLSHEHRHRVVSENLVSFHNPKGPPVLGSPFLLLLMETAAWQVIAPHLDEGEDSVGVGFDFEHLAPTPAGMIVTAKAIIRQVEGHLVTVAIEAHDGVELISQGTHRRAVIQTDRFRKRVARKLDR
jgi:fluoroacetyl-CoA thioesterase